MIAHRTKSKLWRTSSVSKTGNPRAKWATKPGGSKTYIYQSSLGRAVVSFEYLGQ